MQQANKQETYLEGFFAFLRLQSQVLRLLFGLGQRRVQALLVALFLCLLLLELAVPGLMLGLPRRVGFLQDRLRQVGLRLRRRRFEQQLLRLLPFAFHLERALLTRRGQRRAFLALALQALHGFLLLRHGESLANVQSLIVSSPETGLQSNPPTCWK